MKTALSGKDVLEMAIGMEEISGSFYQALGLASDDPQVIAFCASAAQEEARHRLIFERILQRLEPGAAIRPTALGSPESATEAKRSILPDPVVVHRVAIGGDRRAALAMAIQMEQNAIHFYQGLPAALPDSDRAIRLVITEEKRHLSSLQSLAG